MAYATYTDVNDYLSQWAFAIGSGTTPSSTVVATWITRFEARLNAMLMKCGYTTPATGTADVALLADVVSQYIAYRVWVVIYQATEIEATVAAWKAYVDECIEAMKECAFVLPDQWSELSTSDEGTGIGVTMLHMFEDESED